jgi:hypothetical protein
MGGGFFVLYLLVLVLQGGGCNVDHSALLVFFRGLSTFAWLKTIIRVSRARIAAALPVWSLGRAGQ